MLRNSEKMYNALVQEARNLRQEGEHTHADFLADAACELSSDSLERLYNAVMGKSE